MLLLLAGLSLRRSPPPRCSASDDERLLLTEPALNAFIVAEMRHFCTNAMNELDYSGSLADRRRRENEMPGEQAVEALCEVLSGARSDHDSALLKHEIAFVLGQLEHPAATAALARAVRREGEHGMVRHEAAEALGAIGTPEAVEVLREYCAHSEEILRESCWVALMWLE